MKRLPFLDRRPRFDETLVVLMLVCALAGVLLGALITAVIVGGF